MIFDLKPLREITEGDLRAVVNAGLAEHFRLEYKSELYQSNDRGRREFLLDTCMFANAQGGMLLLGIKDTRDEKGQATGIPDPDAPLGLEVTNPELVLQSYDARIVECIEDRLRIESHAIPVAENRFVLAFRVPNSTIKPHCVRIQGHVYFPVRRERHRNELDIREIKDMAIRLASQLERAESLLKNSLANEPRPDDQVQVCIGLVPVFHSEFQVDIRNEAIKLAFGQYDVRATAPQLSIPQYAFEGLIRSTDRNLVTLSRNGLIKSRTDITIRFDPETETISFKLTAIDKVLRNFIIRAQQFFPQTNIEGPFLLRMSFHSLHRLVALDDFGFGEGQIEKGYWKFPSIRITNISDPAEDTIRPLCDHVHQMFGHQASPCFDLDGHWHDP